MNLIEQLGGYENVSKHFNRIEYHAETKIFIGEWFGFYSMRDLKDALLEHRRQHNIFEAGDYYVYLYEWDSDLDIVCKFNPSEWNDHLWNIKNMIRHATDEEIKAGRRL